LLEAPSNLALNTAREGASTASLGNLFQCLTTPILKNFFLISNLNIPSFFLKWCYFQRSLSINVELVIAKLKEERIKAGLG